MTRSLLQTGIGVLFYLNGRIVRILSYFGYYFVKIVKNICCKSSSISFNDYSIEGHFERGIDINF
jgi:hypothetical protein